jgi:hypothetical protein
MVTPRCLPTGRYGNAPNYRGPKTPSCIPRSGVIPQSSVRVPWTQSFTFAPGECWLGA